ncbi:MAG: hypothetical protein GF329_07010 [Candidatus Lokiarchaeota archaeon]|nr:hypothetical protein [Candidatus Lokiarchaeota archaeon]
MNDDFHNALLKKIRNFGQQFGQELNQYFESQSDKIKKILDWAQKELGFKRCAIFDNSGLMIESSFHREDVNYELLGAYGVEFFDTGIRIKDEIFKPLVYPNTDLWKFYNKKIPSIKVRDILIETNAGTLLISPLPFPTENENNNGYIGFIVILLEKEELYNLGIIKANLNIIKDKLQKEIAFIR